MNQLNTYLFILLAIFLCFSCKKQEPKKDNTPLTQYATSSGGMVVAGQPLAVKAGQKMLQAGGNAVDAAVATAFALSVVEPSMSGLGGRLQAIVHLPNGDVKGVDATTQAPLDYDPETAPKARYGYPTIGIPGVVAGLTKLLEDHGSLPLETVMAPAIELAKNGFNILPGEASRHQMAKEQLLEFAGSRQYFLKDDTTTYQAGDLWVQADLAQTLEKIATGGRDAFYKGEIAQKIVADIRANGGVLSEEALAQYEAKDSEILKGNYRGYELNGLWMPSFGAITIEILHILENLPMQDIKGADWASAVYQAVDLAYDDRGKQLSDSLASTTLIDKAYAKELATQIVLDSNLMSSLHPTKNA